MKIMRIATSNDDDEKCLCASRQAGGISMS